MPIVEEQMKKSTRQFMIYNQYWWDKVTTKNQNNGLHMHLQHCGQWEDFGVSSKFSAFEEDRASAQPGERILAKNRETR